MTAPATLSRTRQTPSLQWRDVWLPAMALPQSTPLTMTAVAALISLSVSAITAPVRVAAQTAARSAVIQSTATADTGLQSFHDSVADILARRTDTMMRWSRLDDVEPSVRALYAENNWQPLWSASGMPTPVATSIARVLRAADDRGLSPDDYDATVLGTPQHLTALRDVAMTVDLLRFAAALRFGRVDAATVYAGLHLPRDTVDLTAFVNALRRGATDIAAAGTADRDVWIDAQFDTLEPPWIHYWLLRKSLQTYRAYITGGEPMPPTLTAALVGHRIQQIDLALERWRWLPQAFQTAPIFINIPAFRLYAFSSPKDDGASTLLNMDIAVGKAFQTQTPVFSALLTTVIFSPYWDIPPSIAGKEILPKARRDLAYLVRNHMEIVSVPGDRILPLTQDALGSVSRGTARIRQRPGSDNALGGVKFVFPNAYNVYLHDTPLQSVFLQQRRDVSHGCIRVAEPARLAAFVLRDQPGWTAAAIASAMHQPRPHAVVLTTPIPVFIVYTTVIARADGDTRFYDDLYGHDRALAARLAHGYPYTR